MLTKMNFDLLTQHCTEEMWLFRAGGEQVSGEYSLELFRRALVERDPQAWEVLYQQYKRLVRGWIYDAGLFATGEEDQYFTNRTFEWFWKAMQDKDLSQFNLARLLQYLKMCARAAVIDHNRRQAFSPPTDQEIEALSLPVFQPEAMVTQDESRREFWQAIQAHLKSEADYLLVYESFLLGLKPREIYDRHPDVFRNIDAVYNGKRNLLDRLRRDPNLRQFKLW